MMRHLHNKLFFAVLVLFPLLVWALPSDRDQAINIEADHAQFDDKQGITQYKGKAVLTQGSLRIEGDIITFYYDDKQLIKVVAQGKLAHYKQIQKQGDEPVHAQALQMEYYAQTQKIFLIGQGHIWQAGNEFSGHHIEYDIVKNVINAHSAPTKVAGEMQKNERIHIIIQPGNRKKSSSNVQKPKVTAATAKIAPKDNASGKTYPTAITNSSLNIRTGPGTQYDKIGTLAINVELIILTEQKNWIQVRGMIDEQAVIGWVNRRYVLPTN